MTVAGVVLTGGASRRMGRDKALVEVAGIALAVRAATVLRDAGCDPVWCQGGDGAALTALGLAWLPDPLPGEGPVTAVAGVLARLPAPAEGAVVVACDLPDLTAAAVRGLVGGDRPATLAVAGEAQLAGWWPRAAADAIDALVAGGMRSYRALVDAFGARLVEVAPAVVRNVNEPGDL